MTLFAMVLIFSSSLLHASWNLISKRKKPSFAFFFMAAIAGTLFLSPAFFYSYDIFEKLPSDMWLRLLGSGCCLSFYYFSLSKAYRSGDMSIAYPIARSFAVVFVLLLTFVLGHGHQVGPLCVLGIVMVVAGCFVLPMNHFKDISIRNYFNATCGYALLAALSTAGYSLFDDAALRMLRETSDISAGTTELTIFYAFFEALIETLLMSVMVFAVPRSRKEFVEMSPSNRKTAAIAGIMIMVSYVLILISYAHVQNVSYAIGFRQISVPLGALMSILILKEKATVQKIVGVLAVFAGLVLIALD